MVYTDAYGGTVLTAYIQEGDETVTYALYLLRIFIICLFQMLERACRIHIIARIDAYLLHISGGYICYGGVEMYISH